MDFFIDSSDSGFCLTPLQSPHPSPLIALPTRKARISKTAGQPRAQSTARQCRICLEDENEGRLVQPCMCLGSVAYAHEKCMMEWIKRKADWKVKDKVSCEMCQISFRYKVSKDRRLSLEQFGENYNKQKCNFYVFMCFALLLMVLASEGQNVTQNGAKIKEIFFKQDNWKVVYVSITFILYLLLAFLLILFILQYAIKTEVKVSQVFNFHQAPQLKPFKIYPKAFQNRTLHAIS